MVHETDFDIITFSKTGLEVKNMYQNTSSTRLQVFL